MSEQNIQEDRNIEADKGAAKSSKKKLIIILSIVALVLFMAIIYLIKRINEFDWLSNQTS